MTHPFQETLPGMSDLDSQIAEYVDSANYHDAERVRVDAEIAIIRGVQDRLWNMYKIDVIEPAQAAWLGILSVLRQTPVYGIENASTAHWKFVNIKPVRGGTAQIETLIEVSSLSTETKQTNERFLGEIYYEDNEHDETPYCSGSSLSDSAVSIGGSQSASDTISDAILQQPASIRAWSTVGIFGSTAPVETLYHSEVEEPKLMQQDALASGYASALGKEYARKLRKSQYESWRNKRRDDEYHGRPTEEVFAPDLIECEKRLIDYVDWKPEALLNLGKAYGIIMESSPVIPASAINRI